MRLPVSIPWFYRAPFLRHAVYWLKIAFFSYSSLIRGPGSACYLWNWKFVMKLAKKKVETRIAALSYQ